MMCSSTALPQVCCLPFPLPFPATRCCLTSAKGKETRDQYELGHNTRTPRLRELRSQLLI